MPQKTTISKYIKHHLFLLLLIFMSFSSYSQKVKIDGVAVVIGKNIVLNSDIDKFKQEINTRSEGKIKISDCEMLEELMQQKLLAHHAVIDSITVSDAEINGNVETNLRYFTQQFGNIDKVIKAYGFNDIDDLKKEIYEIEKEKLLIAREQAKITEKIDVTPEEVRLYFNGLKDKKELPEISAEVELAQIVIKAIPSAEENERIIAKLNELKKQIEEGANFKMKAIINSDDPGVTQNGGKYEVTKESQFIKEFKETAFSLDLGQVSKPFKSDYGYHIMQLHEIRGNIRIASHILMQSKVPDELIKTTKDKAEEVRKEILDGKITFEEAVKKYSNDNETKNNRGIIVNPYTGDSKFDLTRMDPDLYARVAELKKEEITDVYFDQDGSGVKMFKFILMKERTDTHIADLVKDYVKIQELALLKKKEETVNNWSKEKIKDTYIKLSEIHTNCTFERNWKKEINN
ncbi:MAG: peptidylprolyl isomerase [Flavobacteriia bacterium]|nr:peptidylprolyl isomerase [Flavobacteriia bacterium]OIP45864.1 MAG: peptidylprolyl isomerase [Flavobacteriaceae bacterium CG2_30_31_66]PIV96983.1 MAG: peptidylprolyl isomerase [Flavobacteriaceae bacterium CG17_big_fil_post_rev_8_21_14_2_50_31_13]PIX12575.1 MAG: peptidylprolyl isomerase [Flavobacteriaceae bacterium CG_4_8_14_3_um_filter_31_8]PIY15160.1 MAG: peptidylprolyl isomerase [Flavobacteriaceae bacterium CG_4_10_14_3_um_filter_31_253]PIZ09486.1 MAG: peptidylprolyl isomerase [Flavobacter